MQKIALCHPDRPWFCKDMCKSCYAKAWYQLHPAPRKLNTKQKAVLVKQVISRRRKFKQKAVEYKGGKCVVCGYNKCNRALEFHHTDPTTKKI